VDFAVVALEIAVAAVARNGTIADRALVERIAEKVAAN
jgi:hypothetical protein